MPSPSPAAAGAARRPRRAKPVRGVLGDPPPGLFPSRGELLRFAAVVSIAAAVAFACNLAGGLLTRRAKPFCDSSYEPLDSFDDFCEPCPENGQCIDGKLECGHGFRKHRRICIEDGLISETAKKLSELLEKQICDEHAQVLCGEAGKIWFQEADVAAMVDKQSSKNPIGLSNDGFKVVKNKAMETVQRIFEARLTSNRTKEFRCPELLADLHKPLSCHLRQWIYRNIIFVVIFCIMFVGLLCVIWSIYRRRVISRRAEKIYQQICEILEDNTMNAKGASHECEPWVVASWLRDHLLLPRERKHALLWKKVEELMAEDSRIDRYPKLIKGESKVVVEWQASGSLSAKIKKMKAINKTKADGATHISFEEMDSYSHERCSHGPPLEKGSGTKARFVLFS